MISVYIRIVYYLRKTQNGTVAFPNSLPKVRLPRFLFIAAANETVDNCAAKFLKLVDRLSAVHDPIAFKQLMGRKYAKAFTTESIDPRVKDIANKGDQFVMEKVSIFFHRKFDF